METLKGILIAVVIFVVVAVILWQILVRPFVSDEFNEYRD